MQANPCGGKMMVNPCDAKMGTVFHIDDPAGRNSITFKSEAPLEDIVGTSNQITGYLVFDPSDPKKGGRGELSVPTASLNTGIPVRNEHLQSADWLNAARYPHITLHITDVRNVKTVKSSDGFQTYEVTVVAEFGLRGELKEIEFPGRITYMKESEKTRARLAGNLLAARAEFEIPLAAFGITGPSGAGLVGSKVGETIAIEVSLVGSSAKMIAAYPGNPCNPCGGKTTNPCNPCGGQAQNPCNPCGM
jgi:polyisoprenoid-binding protein YceI